MNGLHSKPEKLIKNHDKTYRSNIFQKWIAKEN